MLATLCNWLDKNGTYTRHLSEVTRRPLELLAELLVTNGEVEMVDDTIEARTLLERRYAVNLNASGRGTKNVMHNIQLSVRRDELASFLGKQQSNDIHTPLRRTSMFTDEDFAPPPGYEEAEGERAIPKAYQRPLNAPIIEPTQRPTTIVRESTLKEGESIEDKMKRIEEADKAEANALDEFLRQQKEENE